MFADNRSGQMGRTALHWASAMGHNNSVQVLLSDQNVDANRLDHVRLQQMIFVWAHRCTQDGRTSLHLAVLATGSHPVVRTLLASDRVNPNVLDQVRCRLVFTCNFHHFVVMPNTERIVSASLCKHLRLHLNCIHVASIPFCCSGHHRHGKHSQFPIIVTSQLPVPC